jgi:transcription termination factor Rho
MTETQAIEELTSLTLQELKRKSPAELLALAESLEIEAANTLRSQDMMFAILKSVAERGVEIGGAGVVEILSDGFGFLRSPQSNYLSGPDDIYVSPQQIRNSVCAPATPSKARSKRRKTANAISR